MDARNYSTAQFNRLRGGGFEYSEYYDQAQIRFMDLPNLHIVRVSFERLTQLYTNKSDVKYELIVCVYFIILIKLNNVLNIFKNRSNKV